MSIDARAAGRNTCSSSAIATGPVRSCGRRSTASASQRRAAVCVVAATAAAAAGGASTAASSRHASLVLSDELLFAEGGDVRAQLGRKSRRFLEELCTGHAGAHQRCPVAVDAHQAL